MALGEKTLVALMSMLMSEISEDAYCSTWEMGTEYAIWKVIQGASSDSRWKSSISPDQMISLRELSAELDGWLVYDAGSEDYVRHVSIAGWHHLYEAHITKVISRKRARESRNE